MNEQIEQAKARFSKASLALHQASSNKVRWVREEQEYGKAYQQLVKLGVAVKLRKKYRG